MWTVFDGNMVHADTHQRGPGWFHYVMGSVHLHKLHHAQDGMVRYVLSLRNERI